MPHLNDLGETLEVVFPYPYRFWRAVFSRSYRRTVKTLYRAQSKTWVAVDVLVSGFFFLAEAALILGLTYLLLLG